ncbi:putative o- protein [Lasiodiplodia theobromae]|uniref:O- protein n=1 Tax=Lasiodiplodia theobromae TaxID=45133 RepID=A0A8H7MAN5_9PEZI|nr:putative o- protein [Lasiodiplodia theobromae]
MSSLIDLAQTIAVEAKRLADYIEEINLPNPSFAADGPAFLPIPSDNQQLKASQGRLHAAAQDITALQFHDNTSLHIIIRFKIADAIPNTPDGATFDAIAATTGLPTSLIARLIRHASLYYVFHEPRPGVAAHTRASLALRTGEGVRDRLDMVFEELGPSSLRAAHALSAFPGSEEPNETGFGLAFGGQSLYQYLSERPERARVFGGAMATHQETAGRINKIDSLIEGFDWKGLGQATVVDVGGSHGQVSIAIAKVAPELRFVVQDLPTTAEQGRKMLDPALAHKISFMAYDMNDIQPVAADVYLFRHVFPNWPRKYCVKFLKNLVPVMKPGARVILNQGCLSKCDTLPRWENKFIRCTDMCMLSKFNSSERTEEEWKEIFRLADPRFKFCGVRDNARDDVFFVYEAVWEENGSEVPN